MRKILLVEREDILLAILKSRLEAAGWMVEACNDGLSAKERLYRFKPNVFVTNIWVPFYSGLELTQMILSEKMPIKIVFLVMIDQEEIKRAALNRGVDLYITKPFDLEELVRQVDSLFPLNSFLNEPA